jgi:hypothetical protein
VTTEAAPAEVESDTETATPEAAVADVAPDAEAATTEEEPGADPEGKA